MYDVCDFYCTDECHDICEMTLSPKCGARVLDMQNGEKMKQFVQNILVYVVIVTVLRGLISNPRYSQYFQFFSGVIMILLMLSPVLSVFDFENEWYSLLEEKVLQMDLDHIKEEMSIADGRFEEMVKEEYKETIKKQVVVMAEENGVQAAEVSVEILEGDTEWQIAEIAVTAGKASGESVEKEELSVETVQIEEKERRNVNNVSKDEKALKRQICSYFALGEDKVHIWK